MAAVRIQCPCAAFGLLHFLSSTDQPFRTTGDRPLDHSWLRPCACGSDWRPAHLVVARAGLVRSPSRTDRNWIVDFTHSCPLSGARSRSVLSGLGPCEPVPNGPHEAAIIPRWRAVLTSAAAVIRPGGRPGGASFHGGGREGQGIPREPAVVPIVSSGDAAAAEGGGERPPPFSRLSCPGARS